MRARTSCSTRPATRGRRGPPGRRARPARSCWWRSTRRPRPVDPRAICFAEQRIIGARVYTCRDFADAVSLLAGDELDLARPPVAVLPLESVAEAFGLAQAADAPIKVLLQTA